MSSFSNFTLNNCFKNKHNKKKYTVELFNYIAPKYNLITKLLSLGMDRYWKKYLISILPDLQSPTILDIASGTGDITFALAKKYKDGTIIGLDFSEQMIQLAQKINKYPNVNFTCQDMCNISFEDNSIDLITGSYALRNAHDINQALNEANRVLKCGGFAYFLDFSKPRNRLLQKIQYLILKTWGNFWGLVIHAKPETYGYIASSLKHFPNSIELEAIIIDTGFTIEKSKSFLCSTIMLYVLRK